MAEPFVGQILAVGFNFAPVGWLPCDGRLVSIAEFDVLYALIGTIYGGDGVNTFGLPDLRGRTPVGVGQGPGRTNRLIGEMAGTETVTLTAQQIGWHNHPMRASARAGTTNIPAQDQSLANNAQAAAFLYGPADAAAAVTMSPAAVVPTGGGLPHENRQPLQTLNYIICTAGIFPSRS